MLIIKLQIVIHKEIVKLSRDNHYQAEECYLMIVIKVPPKDDTTFMCKLALSVKLF